MDFFLFFVFLMTNGWGDHLGMFLESVIHKTANKINGISEEAECLVLGSENQDI